MSRRFTIGSVIYILVSGAVISFVIAQITSYYSVLKYYSYTPIWTSRADVQFFYGDGPVFRRWVLDRERFPFGVSVGTLRDYSGVDSTQVFGSPRLGPEAIPYWSRAHKTPDFERYGGRIYEVGAGWPFAAWKGEMRFNSIDQTIEWWFVYHIDLPPPKYPFTKRRYPILLPLMPIFPGGLFNALFWGGIFYIFTTDTKRSIWFFIRHRRRRKGRCPHCAYDITGLTTCPECGQPVAAKA